MTAKFTNPLENIKIASPCSQDWDAMIGTERQRFCGECKLNVYNLSGMSRTEAENLLANSEGRLCVRFYKRADGTVLTKDCPVGWQAIKRRVSRTAAACFSLLVGLFAGLGLTPFFSRAGRVSPEVGVLVSPTPKHKTEEIPINVNVIMGAVAMPTPKKSPTPKATPTPREFEMGEIAAPPPKKDNTEMLMGKVSVKRD